MQSHSSPRPSEKMVVVNSLAATPALPKLETQAANPTPAQVKRAQAVILAANVAAKGPPLDSLIPPPTQRETSSINNYMELQHYSMTATTTTTDPAPKKLDPRTPTPEFFILNSGSSLSVTPRMADIINPIELPTPIPITGATHVGSTCLGTLIHFVPKSAVKLVSLGSLTASGYMISITKDRSIVITSSTGTTLCTCPIQSNDTWIFPSHLMTRKISHPTAVSTGNSVTPGVTAPPFSIPLDSRHFTKEEVKRATLARQLHHFLGHPNDQFLKSTLDRGLFSRHAHLTSHDIDLMTDFFGSCMACTIGKPHSSDLHVTSLSPPSEKIGQCVFFDLQLLPSPSIGGNTQALIAIDDRSGFVSVFGSKSKDHHDNMETLEQLVASYNVR